MRKWLIITCFFVGIVHTQEHIQTYIPSADSLVNQGLEQWQDFKFGILIGDLTHNGELLKAGVFVRRMKT